MTNSPRSQQTALLAALVVLLLGALAVLLLFGLHLGPFADQPPTASATPSATRVATSTAASAAPSITPSAITTPGATLPTSTALASPSTAYDALLAHVPDAIRAGCAPADAVDDENVVVIAQCAVPAESITVTYYEYSAAETMQAAYDSVFGAVQIDRDSGSCNDHAAWPAESSYSVENEVVGRRLCEDIDGLPTIYWTDQRLAILAQAASESSDSAPLVEFWTHEAGPIL